MENKLEINTVTSATKGIKNILFASESMSDEKVFSAITNISKSCPKEDKALVHLQLFFHLPYRDEFEVVIDDPGDFVFIVPGYCSETKSRVTQNLYCDVVLDGELLTHFLQLALHLYDKKFVQDLTEMVIAKFLSSQNHQDLFPHVLFMLGKISRREGTTFGNFFFKQFNIVLQEFVNKDLKLYEKYEKLCCLFRLAGVCCMQLEDYKASGSDFLELLEEWNFDLTNRIAKETKLYLSEFFENNDGNNKEEPIKIEILSGIENAINALNISADEELEWKEIRKTHRIKWSEFIGVHAFLTKSILEKYSCSNIGLFNIVTKWATNRPKLIRDDFHGEIGDFDQFYKVLKRFGEKERDRVTLLPKFMEFSYKDIYCSKDGLRIAEKYLLTGGDFDTVTLYILTALNKDKIPEECRGSVPPMVKLMIQKLLCLNTEMRLRKNEIVHEIFKLGAHSDLILSEFSYHVNNLCSKIGTIEKEIKDTAQIEHNRDLVYSTCLEDPMQTVMALMRHSIVSQNFKALVFAKPFLIIQSCHPSKNNPLSIGNLCFEKILDNAEEHDPIFSSIAESVSSLISNDIMTAENIYLIVKKKITTLLVSNVPNFKKIYKMYQILNCLVVTLLETEEKKDNKKTTPDDAYVDLLQELFRFALNTKKLTFFMTSKTYAKEIHGIRFICSTILTCSKITSSSNNTSMMSKKLDEELMDANFLNGATLIQLANMYIRIPDLRKSIKFILQNSEQQLASEFDFCNVVQVLVSLVHDSGSEEWPDLLEFLFKVVVKSPSFNDHDLPTLLSRSIIFTWNNCLAVNAQPVFRQYLKFYRKAIQHLLKNNLTTKEAQSQFVETLVCLVQQMYESMRRRKTHGDKTAIHISIQQVLLLTLEVINGIIGYNKNFGNNLKEDILDSIAFLPIIQGGCEPIRKCIIDRVQYFENPKLIPLRDDCDETEMKLKNVVDVSNLQGLLRSQNISID